MKKEEKKRIKEQLLKYVEKKAGSQSKAATMLGISSSTVSVMLALDPKGQVSDDKWREVAAKTRPAGGATGWQLVETGVFREITAVLQDAQEEAGCTWIVAEAGSGKSTTARHYAETHTHAHYVLCADMVRREFLRELARSIGRKLTGTSLRECLMEIVEVLISEERPVLIFDEADKLTDGCFNYFIQIYNLLEDRCGLVFLSTGAVEPRLRRGLRNQRRGYAELNSRLGRRLFRTEPVTTEDVCLVAAGNGVRDEETLARIASDAATSENDLRRVKKLVKAAR